MTAGEAGGPALPTLGPDVTDDRLPAEPMHDDEVRIDAAAVRRMVDAQFPRWSTLPLGPVASAGTDNALFRLGTTMVVRLPRVAWATQQADKERLWLPRLAPLLPLPIPEPLAHGDPAEGYPWSWSVYRWLPGTTASAAPQGRPAASALALARFLAAMQRIDPDGGPPPGEHNFHRGEALATRDAATREAIAALDGRVDGLAATRAWDEALDAPAWSGPPTWVHGDLHAGNLLVRDGTVSAVIDFGGLGVGDPACDLMVAWTFLTAGAREVLRRSLAAAGGVVDDAAWARGRGWALSMAVVALAYYWSTNPPLAAQARRWLAGVLQDG